MERKTQKLINSNINMALQRVQAWRRLVVPGIVVVGLLMCMIGPVCSQLDDDDVHYDHDAVHEFNVEFDTDDALGMVLVSGPASPLFCSPCVSVAHY